MRARGDEKQGILFTWPKLCHEIAQHDLKHNLFIVFPRSDAAATINFPLLALAATIRGRRLLEGGVNYTLPGVHNAKAEECTTPYMRQNIEINIGVGGLHGNRGY